MAGDDADSRSSPVRGALGRLCTKGVRTYWIREQASDLLELRCVRRRAEEMQRTKHHALEAEDSDGRAEALVEILTEIVGRFRTTPDGRILWIVLGLDGRHLAKTATARRTIAGHEFRGGMDQVKPNTIRQVHEPNALNRLTCLLLAYEDRRAEATPA